jgi:hypothetical protein
MLLHIQMWIGLDVQVIDMQPLLSVLIAGKSYFLETQKAKFCC